MNEMEKELRRLEKECEKHLLTLTDEEKEKRNQAIEKLKKEQKDSDGITKMFLDGYEVYKKDFQFRVQRN